MPPTQAHETSTCRLQAQAGHLVLSLHLVKEETVYEGPVVLAGLTWYFWEERGRRFLLCWAWLQLQM